MAKVTVTYVGMEGTGKTLAAAKQDAAAKAEAALTGDYTPEIIAFRGVVALVWREPTGWCSTLLQYPGIEFRTGRPHCTGSYYDKRKEAIARTKQHVAQLAWQESDGTESPLLADASPAERSEFRSQAEFKLRYLEGRRKGIPERDLHDYASRNPWRPEVWQEPDAVAAV